MDQESVPSSPIRNLQDAISQFSDQYGMACIKCAIMKGDKPYLYLADITIQHKSDISVEEKIQEYDNIILAVIPMALNELKVLVEELKSGQIRLKSLGAVNAECNLENRHDDTPSQTHRNGYYYEWPCRCFRASLTSQEPFPDPYDPIVSVGLPAYPNIHEAIHAFFQHKDAPTQYNPICINFLIPDYGARIKELRIDGKDISVLVDCKELDVEDLIVQISCKKHGSGYRNSEDLRPSDGMPKFNAGFVPDEVYVYLLNSKDGKRIDSKAFGSYHSAMTDGVTVTTSAESLEAMISNGENQHTEFKYSLDKGDGEFLESVVSFANTNNGNILLGVNDDGKVVGSFDDPVKMDKRIRGMIGRRCEPDVAINVEQVDLRGTPVIVVHVEEGKDKPYMLVDSSAYKRVGTDDRVFNRHDFDKIMNEKIAAATTQYGLRRRI